jgi:hypothetical protein
VWSAAVIDRRESDIERLGRGNEELFKFSAIKLAIKCMQEELKSRIFVYSSF